MSFNSGSGNAPRPANQGQQLSVRQPRAHSANFSQSAYNQQVPSFSYTGLSDEENINSSPNLHSQYQPCQPIFYREVPAALSPFTHHSKRLCDNAEPQSASSLAGAYPDQRTAGNAISQTISDATKDYSTRSMKDYQFPEPEPTSYSAVPQTITLPYAIVSRERINMSTCSVSPTVSNGASASFASSQLGSFPQPFYGHVSATLGTVSHQGSGVSAGFGGCWESNRATNNELPYGHGAMPQSCMEDTVFEMESGLVGDESRALPCCPTSNHSPACLLRSTFTPRHLPSAETFEVFQNSQGGYTSATFIPTSYSLPRSELQPLFQAPSRPLPQVGAPVYGIQTSNVRDMPMSTIEGTPSPPSLTYAKRMGHQSLPPLQTAPEMHAHPGAPQFNPNCTATLPSSYTPMQYLSYPSPSSSMNAVRFASSPLDSLGSQSMTRSSFDPAYACRSAGNGQQDRTNNAVLQTTSLPLSDQRDITYQRYIGYPASSSHPWSPSVNNLEPKRAPSSFSSDIEMASSINSYGEEEELGGEPEQEITVNLGDGRAKIPLANPDVTDDAQVDLSASISTSAPLSAFASVRIGTPSLSFASTNSALSQSPVHVSQLFVSTTVLLSAGSSPRSSPFASDDLSSGSDYEATVKGKRPEAKPKGSKNAKNKAKVAATQERQVQGQKETEDVPIKRRKRTIQAKGGAANIQDRVFQCEFCPMSFQRRHDMKRHSRLHTGERPYECPAGCQKAFERNDQLRRHLERTEKCRKLAPNLEEHSFGQGVIKRKRR